MSLSEPPSPPSLRPRRVLYVDDEPALRDVVALVLRRRGYIVDTASDGTEGWVKVNDEPSAFDLVITDRQMPSMDGLIFVRMLRQARFPGRIIVFSSALTQNCLEELETLCVDAVVPKGTSADVLLEAVAQVTRSLP